MDARPDRGDRLLLGDGEVAHAMRQEILGQMVDPLAHLLAVDRDGLADDVGVELLALGEDRAEHGRADCAAEVA